MHVTPRRLIAQAVVTAIGIIGAVIATHADAQTTPLPAFHVRFLGLAQRRDLSDSARLHHLFALDWSYNNVEFPELATYTGYSGQDDRWTDMSVAALQRRQRELSDRLLVLHTVRRDRLNPADQLSFDIFQRGVNESI